MSNTMNESSACLALHQASRVVKPPRDIQQTMVDESETSTTQHWDESEDSATNMSAAPPALTTERTPAATIDRPKPVKKTKKKKKKKAKATTPMNVPKDLSSLAAEVQADSTTKEEELDIAAAATISSSPLLEKTKKEKTNSKPIAYSSSTDSARSLPLLEPLEPPTKPTVSTKKKKKSSSSRDFGENNSLLEPYCSNENKDIIKIKSPKHHLHIKNMDVRQSTHAKPYRHSERNNRPSHKKKHRLLSLRGLWNRHVSHQAPIKGSKTKLPPANSRQPRRQATTTTTARVLWDATVTVALVGHPCPGNN